MATRFGFWMMVLVIALLTVSALAADFSTLVGPYLGQPLPGLEPLPFARGLITFRHSSIAMTPDGREIYWASGGSQQNSSRIYYSRRDGDGWTQPAMLFNGVLAQADCPVISPDGQHLYLNSIHPLIAGERERERIWVSTREGDDWGDPVPLSDEVNALGLHWTCSVDAEGTLYVGAVPPQGGTNNDIFIARREGEGFAAAIRHPVSTLLEETTPFVDPDGEYILVSRIQGTQGHIAASFQCEDRTWTEPVPLDLGGINFPVCPYVSPNGAYLFVLVGAQVYWVDARVIEDAKEAV